MFEADPTAMALIANNAVDIVAQAGPPTDLPAQVPDFVSNVLGEIGQSAGDAMNGIGETISGLTPGGGEMPAGAGEAAGDAASAGGDAAEQAADAAGDNAGAYRSRVAPHDPTLLLPSPAGPRFTGPP